MKFEDVIKEIGEFGPYQKKIYFLICLVAIPVSFHAMMSVFTLAVPEHRCAIPGLENDTYESQGQWHDDLVNATIPRTRGNGDHSQCELYLGEVSRSANKTIRCSKWVYKKTPFENTLVTELNLVCDDISLKTYSNMIFMAGLLAGSLILGSLSDIVGRKKIVMVSILGQFASGLGTGFVHSYIPFVALRFFTSFFGIGIFLTSFVIGMELVGPGKRKFAGIVIEFFWCVGLVVQTGVAFMLRDWAQLQIALSCPVALMLTYLIFLPESPRWLINSGRLKEASDVIRQAAKANNVTLTEKTLSLQDVEQEGGDEKVWHMFSEPVLLGRCLVIFANWAVSSMVYYGLSLNVGSLSGDIYLNFLLSAIVEAASYVFCILFLDSLGRKLMQCINMVLGGLACVCSLFPVIYGGAEVAWVTLTLSLVGKFGASAAFAVIYVYTAELFPTVMRNSAMGLCSVTARIGGILAPYIADISHVVTGDLGLALPLIIFGSLSITAGLLMLPLPETAHKTLPDTVEDAKNFGRDEVGKNSYMLKDMESVQGKAGKFNPAFVADSKS